ncbi:hypothetical protein Tco_1265724 [Tanacetum coccineum]
MWLTKSAPSIPLKALSCSIFTNSSPISIVVSMLSFRVALSESSERHIDVTEYAILFGRIDTLFRLQRSIRCLSRRFDMSYPTGGYGVSGGLPEQSTLKTIK